MCNLVLEQPCTTVDFDVDGTTVAVGTSRGKVFIYDLRLVTFYLGLSEHTEGEEELWCLVKGGNWGGSKMYASTLDSTTVAVVTLRGIVFICDLWLVSRSCRGGGHLSGITLYL